MRAKVIVERGYLNPAFLLRNRFAKKPIQNVKKREIAKIILYFSAMK